MRNAVPEFFANRDVDRPELAEIFKAVQGPILPGLTPNGRRVCVLRGVNKDIATPNIDDCMKLVLMAGDIRLKEEQVGVAGDVYILDATVATPGHFSKVSPAMVKKFLICVQVSSSFFSSFRFFSSLLFSPNEAQHFLTQKTSKHHSFLLYFW